MIPGTYKNGLTPAQVDNANRILSQVSKRKICIEKEISLSILNNVLRDTSPQIEVLKIALEAAQEKISEKQKVLESIPGNQ